MRRSIHGVLYHGGRQQLGLSGVDGIDTSLQRGLKSPTMTGKGNHDVGIYNNSMEADKIVFFPKTLTGNPYI